MQRPVILPQLYLVLAGIFAFFIYTTQWPVHALQLHLMTDKGYIGDIGGGDFRLYWAQGQLAAQGKPLGAYDAPTLIHAAIMESLKGTVDVRPSFYPPVFVLLLEPLGRLSYPEAWHVYNWGSVLLLAFVTVFAFRREYYALPLLFGFGGLVSSLSFGQNSILLTTLYLFVAAFGIRHERLAGLALSVASFKPHLGVLVPLMLLWRIQYRTFMWAFTGLAALVAFTALRYSPEMWQRYLEVLHEPAERLINFDNTQGQYMISLYAFLRLKAIAPVPALAAQAAIALLAVFMLWQVCRRALDPMLPTAALVTATLLVMPHAYSYDMLLLFIPIMVIVRRAQHTGWQLADVEALLPVYVLPYYIDRLNLMLPVPLAPLAMLLLLRRLVQHSRMDHA